MITDASWQDVRVWHEENGRPLSPDEAIGHEPGEAKNWENRMTEDGVGSDDACLDLQEGRYHFTFYGFDGDSEPAVIGVAFELER